MNRPISVPPGTSPSARLALASLRALAFICALWTMAYFLFQLAFALGWHA